MSARWAVVVFDRTLSEREAEEIRDAMRGFHGVSCIGPIVKDETPVRPVALLRNAAPPSTIIREVGQYFGVQAESIVGRCRSKLIVNARHVAMWLVRKRLGFSFPETGAVFAKDHTTVLLAMKKLELRIAQDERLRQMIAEIEQNLAERSAAA